MIQFFPRQIASKGIVVYFIALVLVSLIFFNHAMGIDYMLLGVMWIMGFFIFTSRASRTWTALPSKKFQWTLFFIALLLRIAWVIFSYYYYIFKTGEPFEFGSADAHGYHEDGVWMSTISWSDEFDVFSKYSGISDTGHIFWLSVVYRLFGPYIMSARIVKAIISAFTCVLIYRLARRNIEEDPGRMAAIFSAFMPNLIIYCGLHLKETEMIFLIVAFLERTDYLVRTRKYTVLTIIPPILFAASLFFFRTVIGAVAVLSFFAGLLFTSAKIVGHAKRILFTLFGLVAIATLAGGTVMTEVEYYWEMRFTNEQAKREHQYAKGAQWAKYATGTVLAPMIFVLPFSTMVDTQQDNQIIMHAGNFVRNFMAIFVLIALFNALFKQKNWRNFSTIGAFAVGYLGIISVSGYGNAERFVLPALPCLLIIAAYGITRLNANNLKWVRYWYIMVVVMEISWAYFKLGNRGLL